MGQMRFLLPDAGRASPAALETAYLCGRDDMPWVGRVSMAGNVLTIQREEFESGCFSMLWPVPGRGTMLLSTATLIERERPYNLPVELARGTLHRLRCQIAAWQGAGLEVPEEIDAQVIAATAQLVAAATAENSGNSSTAAAEQSLLTSLNAIETLSAAFVDRVFKNRQKQATKMAPLFGCRLSNQPFSAANAAAVLAASNTVALPLAWSKIEHHEGKHDWSLSDSQLQWCQANNLRVCGGPLIELEQNAMPDWLCLWEGDFDNLLSVVEQHVRAVVTRYRGKVNFWNAAGRLITGDALRLNEEQRLRLAVRVIEVIRNTDGKTPILIGFDQPWAEYMCRRESDLTPIHFADALVRAELGIAGIGLELNIGLTSKCTLPRDLLEFNRQLDRWGQLGLPLLLSLSVPSGGGDFSLDWQQQWLATFVPMLLARQATQGLFWNRLSDAETGDFPHTGLIEASGNPKPALAAFASLRKQFSV